MRLGHVILTLFLALFIFFPNATFGQKKKIASRTQNCVIESSGKQRKYILHLPKNYKKDQKKLIPLVLMLHGRGGGPRIASSRYYGGWKHLADKDDFIVVFPGAMGRPTSWKCWGGRKSEDAVFLADLIKHLIKEMKVDKNKVFMTGHSSGGYMSYCFGAAYPEHVAAIAPMAGLFIDRFGPKTPVSVISIHGMADNVVAYDRKHGAKAKHSAGRTAPESADFFAKHNGCGPKSRKTIADGWIHVDTWSKGKNKTEVVLYSLKAGDHGWPRKGSRSIDATKVIWEFFKKHPRPQAEAQKKTKKVKSKAGA